MGLMAVSYTHLDVYKRQRSRYVSLVTVLRSQLRLALHLPSKNRPLPRDVYKRQGYCYGKCDKQKRTDAESHHLL